MRFAHLTIFALERVEGLILHWYRQFYQKPMEIAIFTSNILHTVIPPLIASFCEFWPNILKRNALKGAVDVFVAVEKIWH